VTITTADNQEIFGIIGSKPPHILTVEERNVVVPIKKMYIDLGVDNQIDAIALGIQIGDMITPYFEYTRMANPKYLCAKA